MGFRVQGSGFRVQGSGCRGQGLWSRVSTLTQVSRGSIFALRRSTVAFCLGGQRSVGSGLTGQGLGLSSVPGLGFRVQGSRFSVQGSVFRVQGSRFKVQGSGFMVWGCLFGTAPSSSWLIICKLTCWLGGTNSSTLERIHAGITRLVRPHRLRQDR